MLPIVILVAVLASNPTAIVDSVGEHQYLHPLQLLYPGAMLDLEPATTVRLAYFASCVHETVRGGRLRVGVTASIAVDGEVERVTGDCEPPLQYRMPGGVPGALVLRSASQSPPVPMVRRLRTTAPILLVPPGSRVTLSRVAPAGRKLFLVAQFGRLDLSELGIELEPDSVYEACAAERCVRLWIDPKDQHVSGPVLERVISLP